ncbi:MAG TPA: amidohydrolase family protein [Gammaproteobacteria bacterium]
MANRREFLKSIGTAAGGAFLLGQGLTAGAQSARREVTINGRRVTTVDIHAHCVFPEVRAIVAGTALEAIAPFPASQILGPSRIDAMNERGIDYQALSMTINGHWWYGADADLADRIVRASDEALARWVEQHPDRFVALSSVALPYPELAAEQLDYAVTQLGARGASIGGQVGGEFPSSERFDPLWAKCEELDVPVFMHPALGAPNLVTENALQGPGGLTNVVGGPFETTLFLTHMMLDGTLDRFPGLRIVGAHGGGYLPSYLGRTEVACERFPEEPCRSTKQPSEYMRTQIFVDSMVFSEEGIRHLVAEMGATQVVYGTDIPFPWPETMHHIIDSPNLSDDEKALILGGNLMRLLRIEA